MTITSIDWQISTAGPGQVVQGVDDINQCISIIVSTTPGSDPMRPLFGCALPLQVDQPAIPIAPGMARAIAKALRLWEPRIEVTSITYTVVFENIRFRIGWKLKIGRLAGETDVLLGLLPAQIVLPEVPPAAYLRGVLATEDLQPLTTETLIGLTQ